MSKENRLSIDFIEEVSDQYKEQKEITIEVNTIDGVERVGLTIDKYFSPTKIKLCIKELFSKLDLLKTYINDYEDVDELLQCWFIMLIIKHFTSLDIPNNFKKQLAVLDHLIETTVLFQVFANFSNSEVEKVMIKLTEVSNDVMLNMEQYKDLFDKLNNEDRLSKEKIKNIIEGK